MRIEIYTDGACSGNPGPGGYGILMRAPERKVEKKFSRGFRKTTNNRMELLAVITALENLTSPQEDVHIFTDSKYVADAINKGWLKNWIKKNFKDKKNPDLWRRFVPLQNKHKVEFHWLKGHAGHPENELCDRLAVSAYQNGNLGIDQGFEDNSQKLF